MTSTMSSLRMCMAISHHLGSEADDLVELGPEFAGHGAEDTRAARVVVVVQNDQGVAVEADVAAVLAPGGDAGADDHALDHVARLHFAARQRLLDAGADDVAQVRD